MHPRSLFLEALSYAASEAYSLNDRQGGARGFTKPEILKRFRESGSNICRTDEDGAIVFHTDGQRMRVETYRKK